MINRLVQYFRRQLTSADLHDILVKGDKELSGTKPYQFTLGNLSVDVLVGKYAIKLVKNDLGHILHSTVKVALRFDSRSGKLNDYEVQLVANYFCGVLGYVICGTATGLPGTFGASDERLEHTIEMTVSTLDVASDNAEVGHFKFSNGFWRWFHPQDCENAGLRHEAVTEEWNLGLHSRDQLLNPNLISTTLFGAKDLYEKTISNADPSDIEHPVLREIEEAFSEDIVLAKFNEAHFEKILDSLDSHLRVGLAVNEDDITGRNHVWIYHDDGASEEHLLTKIEYDDDLPAISESKFIKCMEVYLSSRSGDDSEE